jgi:gluconolactonase
MSKVARTLGSRWNGFLRLDLPRGAILPMTVLLLAAGPGCSSNDDEARADGQQSGIGALTPDAGIPDAGMPAAAAPQPPATDTTASEIAGVVAGGTTVHVIGEGFQGTEGPITLPDGSLIFTETNANRITRIDANDAASSFLENTNGSNALGFDTGGRLISVQTTPGNTKIGVIYPPGSEAVLSDNFEGKPYGRPNDLVVSRTGGVYFSEPGPNAPADGSTPPPPPLPPAVYYIPPGAAAQRVAEGIERPNGITLSPDERTLFVNNTAGRYLLAFDVQADGTLQNRRNFAEYDGVTTNANGTLASGADGLCIDAEGRLYAATTTGVQVFSAAGERIGTIPLSRAPQNIAFAGVGKQTLFIVGRGAAYRVSLLVPGFSGRAK